jgi:small-conductance mechanosensitive channel
VSVAATRWSRIGALILATLVVSPVAAQTPATPTTADQPLAAEAEQPAPVLISGEVIIWIPTGAGQYTPAVRAAGISQRLEDAIGDRSITNPTVTVTEIEESSEVRVGPRLLMIVTAMDAKRLGAARTTLAQFVAQQFEKTIRDERLRRAPGALLRSGFYGLGATVVFAILVWLIVRSIRWLRRRAERWRARRLGVRVQDAEIVSSDRIGEAIDHAFRLVRLLLVLVAFDLYLTFVLGLFPWTRAVSHAMLGYVVTPLRTVATAFVGYLPNLLFVVFIALIIRGAIRLVKLFFNQIEEGKIVFRNFPVEWADPTYKIVRLLLVAFGLVVAFPYLPASDSAAFTGVSVFAGVLFSLSSSSAISNAIAGVVLTYTGAFRLGDRVKLGETFGDIIETSMLATRVRTIKNEDITIPNSLVLGSAMTNYTRQANSLGLILHTSVTIGYEAPWRQIHGLLIDAALATPEILASPPPFVWQTALNDFYVTYEINAYTANARDMINTYAVLHANIQDKFFAAGVEIMSPHYTSVRDGHTVQIPEAQRPPGYRAPAFRVEHVGVEPISRPRS